MKKTMVWAYQVPTDKKGEYTYVEAPNLPVEELAKLRRVRVAQYR